MYIVKYEILTIRLFILKIINKCNRNDVLCIYNCPYVCIINNSHKYNTLIGRASID